MAQHPKAQQPKESPLSQSALFAEPLRVINVGITEFAESVNAAGGDAVPVDWRPPGAGDPGVARSLAQLINRPEVEEANGVAFQRYLDAQPVLEGIGSAGETVPGLTGHTIFHAGPPIG